MEGNKLFQGFIFLLFLLTLFYGSDFMAIWEVESQLAIASLDNLSEGISTELGNGYSAIAQLIISGGLTTVGYTEWGVRISSLLILVASLLFFYKLGAKVFSTKFALITVLLAASSFPLLLIGKIATTDIWLFGIQLLMFPVAIIQLKKKSLLQTIALILLGTSLVFINPLSAIIFNVLFFGSLLFLHKTGKNIWIEALVVTLSSIIIPIIYNLDWINNGFLFSYKSNLPYYFIFIFFGLISSIGFVPTVLFHLFKRLAVKEEMAILTFAGLIAGLFSISFLPHFILLFLVGKQLDLIEEKNYPYHNQIKIFTIIQVVLSFFVALLFLVNGFQLYQGVGFRKALLFGIPLWGSGIFTLVAIYSKNRQSLILSVILGGLLSNFLFWTQIMPTWEAERNIYKDMAVSAKNIEIEDKRIYFDEDLSQNNPLHFYRKTLLKKEIVGYTSPMVKNESAKNIYIIKMSDNLTLDSFYLELKNLKGREYPWFEMEEYSIRQQKK